VATIATATATLRISGETLVPGDVTNLLGASPTAAQAKGEELHGRSGTTRVAKFGMWRLSASETSPANVDSQISEILDKLASDLSVWSQLSSQYSIDLYCGWFMEKKNEGEQISWENLRALGQRGISLSLDIYSGDGEGNE
jgi:hypothetical protein